MNFKRSTWISLAIVSAVICAAVAFLWPSDFPIAWLTAAMLVWSRSVGSLILLFVLTLTGGRWGAATKPWLLRSAGLLPLAGLLFLPWLAGIESIYPWTQPDYFAAYENVSHRQWFYQTPFYVLRTAGYFTVWIGLLCLVRCDSALVAGLSLVAILLTVTWASIDWIMSFDPFLMSTLLGVIVGAGATLSALAYAVLGVCHSWDRISSCRDSDEGLEAYPTLGDLSSLLLAFLLMWAYLVFSQFLIMWSGDLPAESHYYVIRNRGAWRYVTPAIAFIGFALPFLCLLSYRFKRSPHYVGTLALGLIFVRLTELAWMVLPADDGGNWRRAVTLLPATVCVVAISSWRPIGFFNETPLFDREPRYE